MHYIKELFTKTVVEFQSYKVITSLTKAWGAITYHTTIAHTMLVKEDPELLLISYFCFSIIICIVC